MADADMTARWTARLSELAAQEGVPGATLGIWADERETLLDLYMRAMETEERAAKAAKAA